MNAPRSWIGFISTFGIAILDDVALVSDVEQERAVSKDAAEAAKEAAEKRLRPVLTTALVALIGFLPMAVSTSAGAEVQRPLATVVIGGLITATLLTLLVLPSLYPLVPAARLPFGGKHKRPVARAPDTVAGEQRAADCSACQEFGARALFPSQSAREVLQRERSFRRHRGPSPARLSLPLTSLQDPTHEAHRRRPRDAPSAAATTASSC